MFGGNNALQRQQSSSGTANTGFGGFGASSAGGSGAAGGFGGFGASTGFGSSAPGASSVSAGGGPFGGNSGGGFGTAASTGAPGLRTGLFGSGGTSNAAMTPFGNAPTTSSTGAGGSATGFGASSAPWGGGLGSAAGRPSLGGTGSNWGAPASTGSAPSSGTGSVTFRAVPSTETTAHGTKQVLFDSITFMNGFENKSFEELRHEDYRLGNRGGGASGAPLPTAPPSTGMFGNPSTGPFGSNTMSSGSGSTGFGGMSRNTASTNLFGAGMAANAPTSGATTGFGSFGAGRTTGASGGGLFGTQQPASGATASTSGGFGAGATSGALFGGSAGGTGFGGGASGGFGSTAPRFGFGSSSSTPFGASAPQSTTGFGGGSTVTGSGLFGTQQQQQPQQQSSATPFGSSNSGSSSLFGSRPTTSGFGFGASSGYPQPPPQPQQQQQQQQTSSFANSGSGGGFGSSGAPPLGGQQQQQPQLWSRTSASQPPAFSFGANNAQGGAKPAPSFSFGSYGSSSTQPSAGGNQQQTDNSGGGGGGGSLFGNLGTTAAQTPQPFGVTPTPGGGGGGLFGYGQAPTSGANVPAQPNGQASAGGGGGFSFTPAPPAQSGLFTPGGLAPPNSAAPPFAYGGGQGNVGAVSASKSSPYGALPPILESSLQPPAVNKENAAAAAQPAASTPAGTAYASPWPASVRVRPRGAVRAFSYGISSGGIPLEALFHASDDRAASMPAVDGSSGELMPWRRDRAVKQLVLHTDDLRREPLLTLDDIAAVPAAEPRRATAAATTRRASQAPSPSTAPLNGIDVSPIAPQRDGNAGDPQETRSHRFTSADAATAAQPQVQIEYREFGVAPSASQSPPTATPHGPPVLTKPGYYTVPDMDTLRRLPDAQLAAVHDLVIGRHEVGEIRWLQPVDVRGLDLDRDVELEPRQVTLYPDAARRPPPGHGLNRPARIRLLNVYRMDKRTGAPTRSPPAIERFVERLETYAQRQGAKFIAYDPESGTWDIEVEEFR
ncbi:hypothetical protein CDCA_CDCA11G3317 [Cyanidium caldarium]|uniref:Peptidase S59 domain-containing protein n=1 Tax=Cyanidium caldarium TaxID=2771 RepID=A0AAV9IYD0_CYACA|nr:hypothetical protein CDCA_CDCA11G3317 [Cyanidium caldarium]